MCGWTTGVGCKNWRVTVAFILFVHNRACAIEAARRKRRELTYAFLRRPHQHLARMVALLKETELRRTGKAYRLRRVGPFVGRQAVSCPRAQAPTPLRCHPCISGTSTPERSLARRRDELHSAICASVERKCGAVEPASLCLPVFTLVPTCYGMRQPRQPGCQ